MNYLRDTRQIEIKPDYIKLGLKGNDLIIYSLIASNSKQRAFDGSLKYIEDWTNCTRQTVITVLDGLVRKRLLVKSQTSKNDSKVVRYSYTIYTAPPIAKPKKQTIVKLNGARNFTERQYTKEQLDHIFRNIHSPIDDIDI